MKKFITQKWANKLYRNIIYLCLPVSFLSSMTHDYASQHNISHVPRKRDGKILNENRPRTQFYVLSSLFSFFSYCASCTHTSSIEKILFGDSVRH